MRPYRYELVGGHPVLDFLNTIHDWRAPPPALLDRLTDYEDVVGFAVASGVLRPSEARRVEPRKPGPAALRQLRDLRAILARVLEAVISSSMPADADLDRLALEGARAAAAARLRSTRGSIARTIDVGDAGTGVIRMRLADAAIALLTSAAMRDVKSCPACGWFFLDTTKNRSRRWCSMQTCGAAAKARAYYYRRTR